MADETTATTTDRAIVVSRVLDAPRDRVWRAFTDPEQLGQWWGPNGFTCTFHETDMRPGGKMVFTMHGPDGVDFPNEMQFVEMAEPELIRIHHSGYEPAKLKPFEQEITLEEVNGKTKFTLRNILESPEELRKQVEDIGAVEGAKQTLGRLADFLNGKAN